VAWKVYELRRGEKVEVFVLERIEVAAQGIHEGHVFGRFPRRSLAAHASVSLDFLLLAPYDSTGSPWFIYLSYLIKELMVQFM
jgi:hypothetical protein